MKRRAPKCKQWAPRPTGRAVNGSRLGAQSFLDEANDER